MATLRFWRRWRRCTGRPVDVSQLGIRIQLFDTARSFYGTAGTLSVDGFTILGECVEFEEDVKMPAVRLIFEGWCLEDLRAERVLDSNDPLTYRFVGLQGRRRRELRNLLRRARQGRLEQKRG